MYTRTYFTDSDKLSIPENYDGNAFRERKRDDIAEPTVEEEHDGLTEQANEKYEKASIGAHSFFERLPIKNFISKFSANGFFKGGSSPFSHLGYEEILIIALMLYMFFSKDGDKECAVMLLFLLFIA